MAEKINLRSSKVKEQKRRVSEYGTETPLPSTAVERGTTRWLNGSTVVIQGLLDVTGTTTISGVLNVSGQTTLSGATTIAGPTGITGPLTIQGVTKITGQFEVTGPTKLDGPTDIGGKTTIKNDLELLAGGLLKAGVTKIEPSGKATFGSFIIDPSSSKLIQAPGGWMFSDGADHLGLASSASSSVNLSGAYAELNYKGKSLRITESTTTINTAILDAKAIYAEKLKLSAVGTTALAPNVYMDANGWLFKTTWTP